MARPTSPPRDLAVYDAKRDFARTPEPSGARPAAEGDGAGGLFVVQRHRARALHYDLRLEVDGVLASWAVPKGPTLDPAVRSLAVQVEDHPMEYAHFEGVIPAGEYGGGDVIVWDLGTWSLGRGEDAAAAVAGGELHFDLVGEKLAGRFVLIRTGSDRRGRNQWLLLHKRDDAAVPGWNPEDHPASVTSGRTNDEVRAAPDALWRSDLPAAEAEVPVERSTAATRAAAAAPAEVRPATDAELVRLDALRSPGRWQVDGHRIPLADLDEVVARPPGEPPLTRRDLVRYHAAVASVLVPHLAGRPVVLRRFPDGLGRRGEEAADLVAAAPRWLRRSSTGVAPAGGERSLLVDDLGGLVWLVGQGVVELRPAWAPVDAPGTADRVVVAVEPGATTDPADVALVGRLFGTALDHLGLVGGVRTVGSGGLEVWVPVGRGFTAARVEAWGTDLVRSISASVPDLVGDDPSATRRGHRLRLRPRPRRSTPPIVPYGIVGRGDAPVAVPLRWDELDAAGGPPAPTRRSVPDRVAEHGDPWAGLVGLDQHLPAL